MKRSILSADQATWLAATLDRNRVLYGGFRMEATDDAAGRDALDDTGASGDPEDGVKGFPADTPVKDMTIEQRAAYWEHQSKKHESRNKDMLRLTGGRHGDDLKSVFDELESLRNEKRTDGEKAVEEAKKAAREEAVREYGPKMAKLAFETALAHREDRDDLIAALNLTSVLTDEGDVDTVKVRNIVDKIAPADKDQGNQRRDFGAGHRGSGGSKSGINAGAELYAASRKKTTTGS